MRPTLAVAALLLSAGWALAQTPKPPDPGKKRTPPAAKRIPLRDLKPCRDALAALGKRHAAIETLRATYRQERTTVLLKRPLVSTGTLCFRREPGCIVFRGSRAQAARIRMTRDRYEVYRPRRQRVERTRLVDPSIPDALFQAFAPGKGLLTTTFDLEQGWRTGSTLEIRLRPKRKDNPFLRDFSITVDEKTHALKRVDYRDPQNDKVSLILTRLELDPELPATAFDLQVPKDAKVLIHPPLRSRPKGESAGGGAKKPQKEKK